MAKSRTNIITHGYHGKVGNQFVLRVHGEKSIMASKPDRTNVTPTQAQIDHMKRFSGAVNYAKAALADPVKAAYYAALATKEVSAYNMATSDFLTKPWIDQIDASVYNGAIGDRIGVIAGDNAKVATLRITILGSNGAELETGLCVLNPNTTNWEYTAITGQIPVAGNKIRAIATDMPGHVAELEITL